MNKSANQVMTIIKHIKTKKPHKREGEEPPRKRRFEAHIVFFFLARDQKNARNKNKLLIELRLEGRREKQREKKNAELRWSFESF